MRSASLLRVISEAGLHPFSWEVRTRPHYGILYFISSEMLPVLKCIPFSVVLTCKKRYISAPMGYEEILPLV